HYVACHRAELPDTELATLRALMASSPLPPPPESVLPAFWAHRAKWRQYVQSVYTRCREDHALPHDVAAAGLNVALRELVNLRTRCRDEGNRRRMAAISHRHAEALHLLLAWHDVDAAYASLREALPAVDDPYASTGEKIYTSLCRMYVRGGRDV